MNDAVPASNTTVTSGAMSEEEQNEKRKQIREIMCDPKLSQTEKGKAVQALMDGRRRSISSTGTHSVQSTCSRSSYANNMAQYAAQAHDYYSSDEEGDAVMDEAPDDIAYGYNQSAERSVASSVTDTSQNSHHSYVDLPGGATYRQLHGRSFSLQDWTDSDRAAAAANTSIFADHPAQISRLMEQSRPHCEHYDRNCTIISPCCGLAFGCRICHDECPVLPLPLSMRGRKNDDQQLLMERIEELKKHQQKMDRRRSMPVDLLEEDHHHLIDRFAIREIICRACYTRQSSKT
jgi:hypothetical protein